MSRNKPTRPAPGQTVEITWKDAGVFRREAVELLTRPASPWSPREYVTVSGARVPMVDVIAGGF